MRVYSRSWSRFRVWRNDAGNYAAWLMNGLSITPGNIATPAGYRLYESMGFATRVVTTVWAAGETHQA